MPTVKQKKKDTKMKKLMIALAVTAMAVASQAAAMKWQSGTLKVPGSDPAVNVAATYGATAMLVSLTAGEYSALETAVAGKSAAEISTYIREIPPRFIKPSIFCISRRNIHDTGDSVTAFGDNFRDFKGFCRPVRPEEVQVGRTKVFVYLEISQLHRRSVNSVKCRNLVVEHVLGLHPEVLVADRVRESTASRQDNAKALPKGRASALKGRENEGLGAIRGASCWH